MYIIDSDSLRAILGGNPEILMRVAATPPNQLFLSSITIHEAIGGRIAQIEKAESGKGKLSIGAAYQFLHQTLEDTSLFDPLIYTDADEAIFLAFPAAVRRKGSHDCRIAAQALRHGYTVVTRNISHYAATGAPCVDWTLSA